MPFTLDTLNRVHLAATVSNAVRTGYRQKLWNYYGATALSFTVAPGVVGGCFYMGLPMPLAAAACTSAFLALGGLTWVSNTQLAEHKDLVLATLDSIFKRLYYKEVCGATQEHPLEPLPRQQPGGSMHAS